MTRRCRSRYRRVIGFGQQHFGTGSVLRPGGVAACVSQRASCGRRLSRGPRRHHCTPGCPEDRRRATRSRDRGASGLRDRSGRVAPCHRRSLSVGDASNDAGPIRAPRDARTMTTSPAHVAHHLVQSTLDSMPLGSGFDCPTESSANPAATASSVAAGCGRKAPSFPWQESPIRLGPSTHSR